MKNCSRNEKGLCASPINPQPVGNFRKQAGRADGLKSNCRSCEKKYQDKNSKKNAHRAKKWYWENKERQKLYKITKNYGISAEKYRELFSKQSGCCAICSSEKKLVVDHCHRSGEVRGLLCGLCNTGIGLFKDDVALLEEAIKYLEKDKP